MSPVAIELLELLVDPEDKGALLYFSDEHALYNPRLRRRYAVRNSNIPVLLVDEAESVDDAEHARLTAKAESEQLAPTGHPPRRTDNE